MKPVAKQKFIPAESISDWRKLLAEPDKQWKEGFSAYETAMLWHNADGFPQPVKKVFSNTPFPIFKDIEILFAFPEYQVYLDTKKRPSQNDIFIIAKGNHELISIAVEAKVDETFNEIVSNWNNGSIGKNNRLKYLCDLLKLSTGSVDSIRYQLLHRTASSLIMAEKLNAKHALMLVNSFSKKNPPSSFDDYCDFLSLYGISAKQNEIYCVGSHFNGIALYLGWING